MKTKLLLNAVTLLCILSPQLARALAPSTTEMAELRRWAAAKFEGVVDTKTPDVGLRVLANNGPVQADGRGNRSLRIGDKQYARGLYCHAVSKVVVQLPSPGETFSAIIGVDSNEQTRPARGSVVFSVSAGDKNVFKSEVLHEGMLGAPVKVDLGGAKEFVLEVGDAGDGIGCDQADWADAKVVLADGQTVWLGDLPITGDQTRRHGVEPFFSFTYDGKPSAELLKTSDMKRESRPLDDKRTEHTLIWTDPKTGLVVRCVGIEYRDFPTVEWTLYFKNTSDKDTPILADIQALDIQLTQEQPETRLHHHVGSPCLATDYQPLETILAPGAEKRIATSGGRPTNSDLPYFNVQTSANEGLIVVVGWSGQWAATFARDKENHLRIRAGQELTHFKLLPGEEVRSPMIVLQFWKGDRIRSQNIWRRWMQAHSMPKPGGKPVPPMISACNGNLYPGIITNAAEELHFLRRYVEEGIKLGFWWQDAGWYPCGDPGDWSKTGTWEVEVKRWPKGIREVSDWCRTQGIKTIVWFEPERVAADTWLTNTHPEWVHGGKNGGLLRLGDPQCRAWLVDHIDKLLTDQGIELYRQDYNIDPLSYWRAADAEDRQGITEIRHVEGYLAFWDELLRRHPGMLIDSCASGGRRNDLETLRRAVPLLRSDYIFEPVGEQNHTYGIASWIPFYGTGFVEVDPYLIRSQMSPEFTIGVDTRRKDLNYDLVRKLVAEWRQVAPCYFGDYYPLTPYNTTNDIWMAWQFDCPERGEGLIQAFRRAESVYEAIRVKLRGLEPDAVYTLANFDVPGTTEMTGRELLEKGLVIAIAESPSAAVITYKKKP